MDDRAHTATEGPGHPLALRLYSLLRDRSDEDRGLVFEALSERLPVQDHSERRRVAVAALGQCAAELKVSIPSVGQYERWRSMSTRAATAPSVGQVRRLFGSWTTALEALPGVPANDPTARRLIARSAPFTREEALAALRAYVASQPNPAETEQNRYCAWAAREDRAGQRVPTGADTIRRIFGSWREALRAVGVEPPPSEGRRIFVKRVGRFTREQVAEALRDCFAEIGAPMTVHRYDNWSYGRDDHGETRPRAAAVTRLYGGFQKGVVEILGLEARVGAQARGRGYSDGEVRAALEACAAQYGRPPRPAEYERWRQSREGRRPSVTLIANRIGGGRWSGALAALERDA